MPEEEPVPHVLPPAPVIPEPPISKSRPPRAPRSSILGQLSLLIALAIIACMLVAWKPWQPAAKDGARNISVTGEAEITAEPDEYVFNPNYEFKNADKKAALADATARTNEIVSKLKSLGIADSKIKTGTSGYNDYYNDSQNTYYASLSVTAQNKVLAQKVQDYLLTTSPTGAVTPQADFSPQKRKQLTDDARNKATKDARAKAEQSARNLDFKLGKVKNFSDNPDNNFEDRYLIAEGANSASSADGAKAQSSPIQQGENKLTYQVKVTYYLR